MEPCKRYHADVSLGSQFIFKSQRPVRDFVILFFNSCRSFKALYATIHVLAITFKVLHDENVLNYLLTSAHVLHVFIHIP